MMFIKRNFREQNRQVIMASLYSLYSRREQGVLNNTSYWKATRDSENLVKRLMKTRVLKGHNGCVNTISWNMSGSRLISGSDDCHLKIYDSHTGLVWKSVHTTHHSNIFSAKFIPYSGDLKAVSCTGIGSVEYTELTPAGDYVGHKFGCQTSITYQVAVTPGEANEFMTCEEKGYVRVFDLREKSSCLCQGCKKDVLYSFPCSVTCMAVHPVSPFYVLFGLGDGTVRLMDRRMVGAGISNLTTEDSKMQVDGIKSYKPPSLGSQPWKITSVQFNSVGSQVLASYSEEYVYLFNSGIFGCSSNGNGADPISITKPLYLSHLQSYSGTTCNINHKHRTKRPHRLSASCSQGSEATDSNNSDPLSQPSTQTGTVGSPSLSKPPVKKLRLRGDWSDTGPEALPEAESGRSDGSNLMNHMSRMFTQWIDMSLNSAQGERRSAAAAGSGQSRRQRVTDQRNPLASSPSSSASSSSSSFQYFDEENVPSEELERDKEDSLVNEECVTAMSSSDLPFVPPGTMIQTEGLSTENESTTSCTNKDGRGLDTSSRDDTIRPSCDLAASKDIRNRQCTQQDTTTDKDLVHLNSHSGAEDTTTTTTTLKPNHSDQECVSDIKPGSSLDSDRTNSPPKMDGIELTKGSIVIIENRTRSSCQSSATIPSINVIEGETDSDDDEMKSCDDTLGPDDLSEDYSNSGLKGSSCDDEDNCNAALQPFMVYKGHRNSRTMIKQANFWGERWVLSGSDCGRVFVWDKWTGEVVNMLMADSHVVNCIQPHPEAYVIATSGIDYDVKLWEPVDEQFCQLHNLKKVTERNEDMLRESRNTITVPSMYVLRVLAYLNRRRRMQREEQRNSGEEES